MDGSVDHVAAERDVRRVEGLLDAKLREYTRGAAKDFSNRWGSQLDEEAGPGGFSENGFAPSDAELLRTTEAELERLLSRLASLLDDLGASAEGSALHAVQNHRAHLASCAAEYRSAAKRYVDLNQKRQLLASLKPRGRETEGADEPRGELARERESLSGSSRAASVAVEEAYATGAMLAHQRRMLESSRSRVSIAENRFPAIHSVITAVRRRKAKNNLVIAAALALCCFIIFLYIIRR